MKYDLDYFIRKFENTRDEKWCIGQFYDLYGRSCANGWCGVSSNFSVDGNGKYIFYLTEESIALCRVFDKLTLKLPGMYDGALENYSAKAAAINNGHAAEYQQETPKKRILAALYDIKKMQQPTYNDITKELAVLPISETADQPIKQLS